MWVREVFGNLLWNSFAIHNNVKIHKYKCTVPYRGQTFSVVFLLSSLGWIQIHSFDNRTRAPLSGLALSTTDITILFYVIFCVAPITTTVLLGSVVHNLRLFILWDTELWSAQMAIVRHRPRSGATSPLSGHYGSGWATDIGWWVWCCWSSCQWGLCGTGGSDRWSRGGFLIICL